MTKSSDGPRLGELIGNVVIHAMLGGILFLAAGTWDLPWVWTYLGVSVLTWAVGSYFMDPSLRRNRVEFGAEGKDRILEWGLMPFYLAFLVVAGLDLGRYHWSGDVPVAVRVAALVVYVAALGVGFWAWRVNRFATRNVRIQKESGQFVVMGGPYRIIRHPSYAMAVVSLPSAAVAIGSWWSLIPLLGVIALFLHRTAYEDAMLRASLDGYADYARKVRWRICPLIW
jgi:protein-S-isoprenylcysteine O-methyltransferase Ste14